ncbi:MAG TPA: PLP-dependent aminotransferase family protein [Chromobacteriaceae bacterium]|nr:PLP-dependent aminotransferase family protein [Chromobacteriaceae bacterium]
MPASRLAATRPHSLLADLLQLRFAHDSEESDNKQLYRLLREAILLEELVPGCRLPSSRQLAAELGIARNTVIHVYERLTAEGYVAAGVGKGTFVLDTRPDKMVRQRQATADRPEPASKVLPLLSRRGAGLMNQAGAGLRQWGAFMPGVPEMRAFPSRTWVRLHNRYWRKPLPELMTYSVDTGLPVLREALADYLRTSRGVRCEPEQIIITNGTHASLQLIAMLLCDPGDSAWVENPSYWGVHSVWRTAGLETVPMPVDEAGLQVREGMPWEQPRLVFVSPSHQYPLGAVMSLARRRQLLAYAHRNQVWVVEDDYDSEFRYGRPPLPSLQGLDEHGRVLYLATFSKVLFPGLRLGYMVVPKELVEPFRTGLSELFRGGQYLTQAVLADFIMEGHFVSHIRRMRNLYAARREALLSAIDNEFGQSLPIHDGAAGLHLVLGVAEQGNDQAISADALARGIITRPLSRYYRAGTTAQQGLLLGYAPVDEDEITRCFATLAQSIRQGMAG